MKTIEEPSTIVYLATVLAVAVLAAIGAPGIKLNASWAGLFLWLMLFVGVMKGLSIAGWLLIAWNLTLVALLMIAARFDEWGVVAFELLLLVQVVALWTRERARRA